MRVVVADLLDETAVETMLADVRPDVAVHAATALPLAGPQRWSQLTATNALRDRGSRLLVKAALRHGVRRVVGQSFLAGYAPTPDPAQRLTETAAFGDAAPGNGGLRDAVDALQQLERYIFDSDLEGVVLRFGFFYGDPGADGALRDALRRRRLPLPGGAPGVVSYVHVDDAADAVLAAVERMNPGSCYNVDDGEPRSFGDYVRAVASSVGAPPPRTVPAVIGRLIAPAAVEFITKHRPLDVTAIRSDLGWQAQRRS